MKSFFKTLLASILGVIIGSVVLMILSIMIFAGVISALGSSETYKTIHGRKQYRKEYV